MTVKELIALYLRHCQIEHVHCPQTAAERAYALGLFVKELGGLDVAECRPYHLTDWVEAHPEWKSVSTRRSKANAVRAAFRWAWEQGRIDRHPFQTVRYAEAERRPNLPDPTLDLVCRLANKRWETAARFLRLTACRLSELCQARWPDVDLEKAVWTADKHKSRKKTGKPKVIPLVPEAVALLRQIREAARDVAVTGAAAVVTEGVPVGQAHGANTGAEPGGFPAVALANADAHAAGVVPPLPAHGADAAGVIFLNNRGTPWTRRTLGQQLSRMKRRYGLTTKASLHGIRHQAATAAVEAGAPLKHVAVLLGHASTAVTERFYVADDELIDAARQAAQMGLPQKG